MERGVPAVDAIASAGLINQHSHMIGFFFASLLAYFVGAILCGVGLLVAIPVVMAWRRAYMYRTLKGEAIAPYRGRHAGIGKH